MAVLASGTSEQELGYSISLITVNALGMIVNFVVVVMFIRFRHHFFRKPKNFLLFFMSIADFLVGVAGILGGTLFHLYAIGVSNLTIYKICGLLPLFGSFFISILSLGIMTADRLISIMFPVKYSLVMNKGKVTILIYASWAAVILIIVTLGILFFTTSPKTELATRGYLLGIFFVISSIVLSISNAYLFRKLRELNAKRNEKQNMPLSEMTKLKKDYKTMESLQEKGVDSNHTTRSGSTTSYDTDADEKDAKGKPSDKGNSMICIWMTLTFIICWLPASVYYGIWATTGHAPVNRILLAFCLCLASSNSLINPLIYFALRKDFRAYLLRIFLKESQQSYSSS